MFVISWLFVGLLGRAEVVTAEPKAEKYHAICSTQFPTTTFVVQSDDQFVNLRIYHHNGPMYAPFRSGLLVPQDLKAFSEEAKVVEKMGSLVEAQWKQSQCTRKSEKLFNCFGKIEAKTPDGMEYQPFALYSSHIQENGIAGKLEYIELTMSYDIQGKSYHIPMKYSLQDCELL